MTADQLLSVRLRAEFLDEALTLLEDCEECYLKLEEETGREEVLAQIFRAAHTIKGSGAAVELADVAAFGHEMEECLSGLREDPSRLTTALVSLLLRCTDALKMRCQQLQAGRDEAWDVSELVVALRNAVSGWRATPAKVAGAGVAFGFFDEDEPKPAPTVEAPKVEPMPKPAAGSSSTIKVDAARIDAVLDLVGELVVLKSQLMTRVESLQQDQILDGIVSLVDKTVRELQDKTMSIRMTPMKPLFLRIQRLARDLALKLDKPMDFVTQGDDTEIDRTTVELLADPLLHLARNAMDHGLESPDERAAAGKPRRGRVTLAARQTGSSVTITVKDDGKGIDRARVLKKAIERGLVGDDAESLPDEEVYRLLLLPGFSTAEKVSDLSGRGVGLDVVKTQVEKLRGTLRIVSKPGQGTAFEVTIPLVAAVTDGMLVAVDDHPLVVPMDAIRELVRFEDRAVTELGPGARTLQVRGTSLPLVDLGQTLRATYGESATRSQTPGRMVVVVDVGGRRKALLVEKVLGQTQVVLKPLSEGVASAEAVAGAAVLGDGRVALVLDVQRIAA